MTTAQPNAITPGTSLLPRSGYIVSPAFDLFFFILSPVVGLLIIRAVVLSEAHWATSPQNIFGTISTRVGFAIGVWTYAHLFAVVFRSHLNPEIFRRHRFRFVGVPILLFIGLTTSGWILAIGIALTWLWDVYHSSMQVFGFCRIYDSKMGNQMDRGRQLDIWMSHLVYIAPIFVGVSLRPLLTHALLQFKSVGLDLGPTVVDPILSVQTWIMRAILVGGPCFVVYYIYSFRKLSRDGYRYSPQKALMLVTTGCVSYYAWGFLHPVGAFFTANFFHALQYFAMVWWSENKNITRSFGLSRFAVGHIVSLIAFVLIVFSAGAWLQATAQPGAGVVVISIGAVVSLMHFWYDGFIWSVQKHQV